MKYTISLSVSEVFVDHTNSCIEYFRIVYLPIKSVGILEFLLLIKFKKIVLRWVWMIIYLFTLLCVLSKFSYSSAILLFKCCKILTDKYFAYYL